MSVLSNQKVAIAATNHSKLDLSSTHICTDNFMMCRPKYYCHLVPGQSLAGTCTFKAMLSPVTNPCFGRARVNLRYFFIPYRLVFPNANEFFVDTIASNSSYSSLVTASPVVTNSTFIDVVVNGSVGNDPLCEVIVDEDTITAGAYDFFFADEYYRFTFIGRVFYSLLRSLGYDIIWNDKGDQDYSALALLCYAKAYLDWYTNSQYMDSNEYLAIDRLFHHNDPRVNLELSSEDLINIFHYTCFVCYDGSNEYFTNAWDSPVAPNVGLFTPTSLLDITDPNNEGSVPTGVSVGNDGVANGTPLMVGIERNGIYGSEYAHRLLRVMSDALSRHRLAGARAVDRFLVDFGINLKSDKVNRSIFVSTQTFNVDFGAVTSNADTEGAPLGDYSGIGRAMGEDKFDFKADEFGMFIAIASVLPSAELVQGIDRHNLHVTKLDFFNPNYDNLSVQMISRQELYVSRHQDFGDVDDYQGKFGWCPRYAEYKVGRSHISGDMLFPSVNLGADSWNLFRLFSDNSFGGHAYNIVHGFNFARGLDHTQYSRIFNEVSGHYDGLTDVYHFAVASEAPMKSLFDSYDFENATKQILLNSNGTKVN